MKKTFQKNALIGILGAAFLIALAIFAAQFSRSSVLLAQSAKIEGGSSTVLRNLPVDKTAIVTTKTYLSAAQLSAGVQQNQLLKTNLNWIFGGKQQRGWYLYEPLICDLIKVENGAEVSNFTDALAQWQHNSGVSPNGVLDEATLSAIIGLWQAHRLKIKHDALSGELLIAPPNDFYAPSRPDELRQVERSTFDAYKKMIRAAAADKSLNLAVNSSGELADSEQFLKIISAYRSRDYQAKLRRASPNSGSAGLAINSPHFTGRALDIYVGGEPVSTVDANRELQVKTPVYKWLVKNAGKFGFKPYFYEPWHWEFAPDEEKQNGF